MAPRVPGPWLGPVAAAPWLPAPES